MKKIWMGCFVLFAVLLFCQLASARMVNPDDTGDLSISESESESDSAETEIDLTNDADAEVENDSDAEVELYSTSWCGYCKKARKFFSSKGISFTEYDIEKDKEAAERKHELDPQSGVPFVVINGQGIHGYSAAAYEKALKGK